MEQPPSLLAEIDALDELRRRIGAEQVNLADGSFNLIYLFSQTASNEAAVLEAVPYDTELTVGISGCRSPHPGYPGADDWIGKLTRQGTAASRIVPVGPDAPAPRERSLNTRDEARQLVSYCQAAGLHHLGVVAPEFHELRAFMSTVTWALRSYPSLRVYRVKPKSLPWAEVATHSQGVTVGTRASLLAGEMLRIVKYFTKGDLAAPTAVIEYLNRRDLTP